MRRREFIGTAISSVAALSLPIKPSWAGGSAVLPARAIGINYFDLFQSSLQGAPKPNLLATLSQLRASSIPFARFSCAPFWPNDWKSTYLANSSAYLSKLDTIVQTAEKAGFGLIPDLCFNPSAISDVVGEPISYWGRPGSQTIAFMQNYVGTIVQRYAASPAIWMWEFANEFNTYADLPNATNWWPKINTALGTPATRSSADLLSTDNLRAAISAFVATVQKYDTQRLICSGVDHPRNNAYNLSQGKWNIDTQAQWSSNLAKVTPATNGITSLHMYPNVKGTFFNSTQSSYTDMLNVLVGTANQLKTPSFVGEFGVQISADPAADQKEFSDMLSAIVASGVNYAAMWVFDFSAQNTTWNVTFSNSRSYQLQMISQANKGFGL